MQEILGQRYGRYLPSNAAVHVMRLAGTVNTNEQLVTHQCASYKCTRHNHKCLADTIGRAVLGVSLLPLAC